MMDGKSSPLFHTRGSLNSHLHSLLAATKVLWTTYSFLIYCTGEISQVQFVKLKYIPAVNLTEVLVI